MAKRGETVFYNSRQEPCLTVRGAARRLRLSHEAVREAITRGALPGVEQTGPRLTLVPIASIDAYRPNRPIQKRARAAAAERKN